MALENGLPQWMNNTVHPSASFEAEIQNKINPFPHYPGPIHNIGGLYLDSTCRVPGVQPLKQIFLRPKTCVPHCLTNLCFEYGNARFPPKCECDECYACKSFTKTNCNHNSNVIHY